MTENFSIKDNIQKIKETIQNAAIKGSINVRNISCLYDKCLRMATPFIMHIKNEYNTVAILSAYKSNFVYKSNGTRTTV